MNLYPYIRSMQWMITGYPAQKYKKILRQTENWTKEQIENYRDKKLQQLILYAYSNVPYYKKLMDDNKISPKDIVCAKDLVKLPILTRDIIRKHSNDLMAKNISNMPIYWYKTGGTTGEPIKICKNRECAAWGNMCYERGLGGGGLEVEESRVRLFGGSLGIDKVRLTSRLSQKIRKDLFLPAFELRTDTAMSYFDKIRRSNARFLLGYASAIYRLAVIAEEFNQEIEFNSVFSTAELMLPEWEQTIQRIFKCAVLPYYGCGEVNSLGFHTLHNKAYMIPEEHALIEVLQGNGSVSLTGEGRFLITDLDNYAMPIMRYLNGDAGSVSSAAENLPFLQIDRLDGRFNSFLMTDNGDLISGVLGPHVFRNFPSVQNYRIIQEEPLRLIIKIVSNNTLTTDAKDHIECLFRNHLGEKMGIHIEEVPEIEIPASGKTIFVINRCLENPASISNLLKDNEPH